IVHQSSAEALPMLRNARSEGVMVTAETCPHYLVFTAEEIRDGATEFKCCPPIRDRENREQLWQALIDGTIDMVVSDHSPCPPNLKASTTGNFLEAWGGISSLQLRLPVMWTAAQARGLSAVDLVNWLCAKPAKLVGLDRCKGLLAVGFDADVVIWNPKERFRVTADMLHHKHKITPYSGRTFSGVVQKTFLRGKKVYDDGSIRSETAGLLLKQPFRKASLDNG
ncbi:MAG TPA: amidohydrolase family protein, partial [Pyrinomonadaceae bacterium]|nr:amidohydrolase family protein [Pyrinomonadaceae bacterium]